MKATVARIADDLIVQARAVALRLTRSASPEPSVLAESTAVPPAGDDLKIAALQAQRAAWHAIIDALPGAAVVLDDAGLVAHHNASAFDLYPQLRTGQPISHVTRNPQFMSALERIEKTGEAISVELTERVPVERRFFATLTRVGGHDAAPTLPRTMITFRDTSEEDKLSQMRADFIANASHELRTPLASLRGFVETLQGPARDDPEARDRFLAIMATQALRMTRLIDDLLSLSRAEMRVHLPPRGVVDLNEACSFVIQTLEPLAQSAEATITFQPHLVPAFIRGEREEIVQVLQNLLQNALKYGRTGGHVDLTIANETSSQRMRYRVAIIDDGPGIAPEHLPRLTERFYRASVSSSREKGGTGLGLAIVKHIVNRHRGELKIASALGVGSTFTISFDALRV